MSDFRNGGAQILGVIERVGDPGAVPDRIIVYSKDIAGVTQLFARASDGTVTQLTPAGVSAQVIVTFAMSPYTILAGTDVLFVDTSGGPITLNLPNPTLFGFPKSYKLIDTKGTFAANFATVVPFAAEKLEGLAAAKAFQTAWGGWTIITDQIDWYSF